MKEFRLPLAGAYNTRIRTPSILVDSSSGVVGIGIVGIMVVGKNVNPLGKDQRFVNCLTESVVNPYTGTKTLYLVKRPGFAPILTPESGSIGNAILIWTGASSKIITAFGATNSNIYDSETLLGPITGRARSISETVISAVATLCIASTDNTAWFYQPAGAVTKITDADFPGNNSLVTVGGFAHLDGFTFIMSSDGRIWNSDLNSVTSWNPSSVVSANSYPDAGIAVMRKGDKIMAFGTQSIQFFYNAGNASGSPLSRIEPLTLKVGCVGFDAICEVTGTLFWAGSSPEGGLAIYQYDSAISRISTPEIETILLLSGSENIILSSTKFYGRSFVLVMASNVTFVYCVEEKAWHEWSSPFFALWYKCAGVATGSNQVTYAISKFSTLGKIFTINPAAYDYEDNGNTYTALIQTSLLGKGTKRTTWHEVELIGDQVQFSSPVTISVSDDDYQTSRVLGVVDLMDARPKIKRCGTSYRRAWILTHEANVPFRIEALAGSLTEGAI